ncbi:tripartite ATP-independent transporter DctP family solute receptor [Ancylobacter aquaticus]|uniref:Tripartite ATP-independent transporter DctP family solute receptor n=1 Tax=Ancylobacter aquaticus TaxID=100 RepID=A0A4R1IBP0_ANCAQ|nr:TRAP transporter substrate-binding protein [Ancylobacter aquaticus]TCK31120.1 tripartite ATP-independent transporter DctP family solute receptor [Ancylobacter aquaticus]
MTRHLTSRAVLGALALGATLVAGPAFAQSLHLKIASPSPAGGFDTVMAQKIADKMKAKLGDQFTYELFDNATIGDEVVHMQQVRTGQIDMTPLGSDAVSLNPVWSIFDMPFIFADRAAVAKALDGPFGQELAASMREKAGLEVLAFGEIGFRQITNSVRPIKTPADFKGMKIRVPGSETRMLTFKTLGATPVNMNFGEVFLALQNKTIDGQENPLNDIVERSLNEVQPNISISNHVYTPITFVMNARKFAALPDDQKAMLKEAALESAKEIRELGAAKDVELLATLKKAGKNEIIEIDRASFIAAAQPLYEQIGAIAGGTYAVDLLNAVK